MSFGILLYREDEWKHKNINETDGEQEEKRRREKKRINSNATRTINCSSIAQQSFSAAIVVPLRFSDIVVATPTPAVAARLPNVPCTLQMCMVNES